MDEKDRVLWVISGRASGHTINWHRSPLTVSRPRWEVLDTLILRQYFHNVGVGVECLCLTVTVLVPSWSVGSNGMLVYREVDIDLCLVCLSGETGDEPMSGRVRPEPVHTGAWPTWCIWALRPRRGGASCLRSPVGSVAWLRVCLHEEPRRCRRGDLLL